MSAHTTGSLLKPGVVKNVYFEEGQEEEKSEGNKENEEERDHSGEEEDEHHSAGENKKTQE